MKATLRHKLISPKKANLVADLVRRKKVTDALIILKFTPKKAAKILYKVIKSAASNAENNFKQKSADLYVKEIIVNDGPIYKRSVPISRGRVHPILKRTSHITVYVGLKEEPNEKPAKANDENKEKTVKPEKTAKSVPEKAEENVKKKSTRNLTKKHGTQSES